MKGTEEGAFVEVGGGGGVDWQEGGVGEVVADYGGDGDAVFEVLEAWWGGGGWGGGWGAG